MPRKRNQPAPADGADALVDAENENRSEEVMVVVPTEEPVRMGGHVLTDQGWVVEDALVTEEPAPETEQE
jgi:hypothetical protein